MNDHYDASGNCIRPGCEWHDGYREGLREARAEAASPPALPCDCNAEQFHGRHHTDCSSLRQAASPPALDVSPFVGAALDYFLPFIERSFAGQEAQDRIDERLRASHALHAEFRTIARRLTEQENR
jgi:hypothetical protein